MLETVLDLSGDSFEERWGQVEERVQSHCQEAGLPYPEETLQALRPWFESVGAWFDWAGVTARRPVLFPPDVDPVLRVVREADQLHAFYGKDKKWNDLPEFSEGYDFFTSTIRWANLAFLRVVQDGLRGDPEFHPRLRDSTILALAEYVDLSGPVVHPSRRSRVQRAIEQRADEWDRNVNKIWLQVLATAVQTAIRDLHETVNIRPNPLDQQDYLNRLPIGEDLIFDRLKPVPEPEDGSEYVAVVGRYPTFGPEMESFLKADKAGQILMQNLLPGVPPADLRHAAERRVTEDLLGPDARKKLRSDEVDPPESLDAPMDPDAETEEGNTLLDRLEEDDPNFGRFEAQRMLKRLIERADLTDGEHKAFLYRKLRGFSVEEAAEEMDSTSGSVRALLSKAKSKLRKVSDYRDPP